MSFDFSKIDFKKYERELINLRRELHKIPEIANYEYKTSQFIRDFLTSLGIDYKILFNTGVSAVIGNEKNDCIALRADMDALPIQELNQSEYKSTRDGLMHACGHDGHTAVLLMAAKILKENEPKLKKSVKLIFQPAEEGSGGAEPMINEGVLENPDVKEVYGFHLWPDTESGKAEYVDKTAFAGSDRYRITVFGQGGHGAMPEQVKNSLLPAAKIILEIERLHQKEKLSVVSACAVNAGTTFNVFPDNTEILGTVRTLNKADRERILRELEKITIDAGKEYSIDIRLDIEPEYPPCENDKNTLEKFKTAAKAAIGSENVAEGKITYGAEDFAYFSQKLPSAHIRIGTRNENLPETHYPLHNPKFEIDEAALTVGLKIAIAVVAMEN